MKKLIMIGILFSGLIWSSYSYATTPEVLILKAGEEEILQAFQRILSPEWEIDLQKKSASRGAERLLFQIGPIDHPHENYRRITVQREVRSWPSGQWVLTFGKEEGELYKQLLQELGIPKHHIHSLKEGEHLSRLEAKKIAFRLENNHNVYNPLGLVVLPLPGVEGNFEGYFDVHIADRITSLVETCKRRGLGLIFTSAFRPAPRQWKLYQNAAINPYPVATPGHSLHEAGFAFDIQISHWTPVQYEEFKKLAKAYGFESIGGDPIHFQADPIAFGYPNRESAIKKNQIDYYRNHQDSTQPTEFRRVPTENRSIPTDFRSVGEPI